MKLLEFLKVKILVYSPFRWRSRTFPDTQKPHHAPSHVIDPCPPNPPDMTYWWLTLIVVKLLFFKSRLSHTVYTLCVWLYLFNSMFIKLIHIIVCSSSTSILMTVWQLVLWICWNLLAGFFPKLDFLLLSLYMLNIKVFI